MQTDQTFWQSYKRPQKDHTRKYVFHGQKWLERSLWLPGSGGECINAAYESGIVSCDSRLVLAEQDMNIHPLIQAKVIDTYPWKYRPYLLGKLSTIKLPWALNFMWADFNGGFDIPTATWFRNELRRNIAEGATICLTHSYDWRNNLFLYQFRKKMLGHLRRLRLELCIGNDTMLTPILMILCLLNDYSFKVCWPMNYRDTCRTMVVYKFENFHKLPNGETNGWPTLVVSGFPVTDEVLEMPKPKISKGTLAAKKAWETRRLKAGATARSNAAHKAWATRRKNVKSK